MIVNMTIEPMNFVLFENIFSCKEMKEKVKKEIKGPSSAGETLQDKNASTKDGSSKEEEPRRSKRTGTLKFFSPYINFIC